MKRTIMTLANNLVGKGWNRSEAMKAAYRFVKENPNTKVLKFYKKSDTHRRNLQTRVVHKELTKFVSLKGGATTNFHTKYVDVAKLLDGENHCIISAIADLTVSLAA